MKFYTFIESNYNWDYKYLKKYIKFLQKYI